MARMPPDYDLRTITGADEMKWNELNEMSVEKWYNEVCGMGKRKNTDENLSGLRFVYHETHIWWPRCELGIPAVGGERLTACTT